MLSKVGNLLVAQSGGPTAVINSSLAGIIQAAQQAPEIDKIIGLQGGLEGLINGRPPFELSQLDKGQLETLRQSNGTALGSCRLAVTEDHYPFLLDYIKANQIRYFLYIGGNGSMRTPLELSARARQAGLDLACLGVPKTVDNDLAGTDFAPGYPSAARWLARTTRDAGQDLLGMRGFDNVKIIEAMGRHSGWLAASATLARNRPGDPPHLVYLPEVAFDNDRFLADVARIYDKEGVVLVVIAEGIRNGQGQFIAEMSGLPRDASGRALFGFTGGAAPYLCELVIKKLGLKARFDRPGTLQRGAACFSELDRQLAFEVGQQAVELARQGATEVMVGISRVSGPGQPYQARVAPVPLVKVAGYERLLPLEWVGPDGLDGAAEWPDFVDYALPLIGGPLPEPPRPLEYPLFESGPQPITHNL
ncbi:MAG: phosphofructokinase [Chloroflexi bacterium]|nr:phosphofructokinase [Chloroflexota bacterium]